MSRIGGVPIEQIVGKGNGGSGEDDVVDVDSGKLKIAGSAEPGKMIDPRNKVNFFTDFFGEAADLTDEPHITEDQGSGTGNAVTGATNGAGGTVTIASASDDGAFTANGSAIEVDGLNWKANMGNLMLEVAISIDDVSEAYCFVGFTDTLPSGTLEQPIYLTSSDVIDSDASNACGWVYDVDATTDQWALGGVKADTDTAPTFAGSGLAPADGVEQVLKIVVNSDGDVSGYINGSLVGTVADAITASTAVTPVIVVANRSANQVIATVDYLWVQADRA